MIDLEEGSDNMKLAEALILRADLQRENNRLRERILVNVKIQEGDEPSEDVMQIINFYKMNMDKLKELIVRINLTNANTPFGDVMLIDKLAERDNLKSKISTFQNIYSVATQKPDRYSRNEVKYICTVDIKNIQNIINSISKELRELDVKIQAQNWTTDLL